MKEKKFIEDYSEVDGSNVQKNINIKLTPGKILNLKRISKPGQRIYKQSTDLFPILRGFGFSVLSTSQGIMTGEEARKKGIGGEVICEVN